MRSSACRRTSPIPAWLPRSADDRLYQEHFLAVDGDLVRGGYILKHQDFVVAGSVVSIGAFQLPLSEGTYDPAAAGVGVQLLRHALRRQPLLYTLGIGSYAEAAARLLMAARFELVTVPFYFRVINARRFLREIRPLRQTRLRRYAMDLAAMSRTGTSTPEVTNAAAAASSRARSLRRASARLRGTGCFVPPSMSATSRYLPHSTWQPERCSVCRLPEQRSAC